MTTNNNQLNAINTLNRKILVSASAGAGKTTILINRLIKRIIHDKVPITNIVAMTFTKAAANEMKKRLIIALNNEINNPNNTKEIIEYVKEQLALSNNANITTIDSFCLKIIKDGYASINLPIEAISNIYTTEQSNLFLKEAINNIFNKYIENNQNDIYHLNSIFTKKATNFNKLEEIIKNIVYKSLTQSDPDKWFDILRKNNIKINSFCDIDTNILDCFLSLLDTKIQSCIDLLTPTFNDTDYIKKKQEIDQLFNYLVDAKQSDNIYDKYKYLLEIGKIKINFNKPSIKGFRSYYKDFILPLIFKEEKYVKDNNDQLYINLLLINFAHDVYKEYKRIKFINKGLDFNDMEHYAYDILIANNYELSHVYKNLFQEVMVDEFQDTNELQYQIVSLIVESTNLFMVGDLKQSIYRFRGAKPEIMQRISLEDDTYNITLFNNYRSQRTIVEFNNYLFNRLLNTGNFKIKYEQKDFQLAELDRQIENNYPICIHNISELNEFNIAKKENNVNSKFIADLINNSIENSQFKKYSSYCILVRTNTNVFLLKKYLEQANIPVFIDEKTGYMNSISISIIVSFLTLLNDITEQISLASVLTSSLYDINTDLLLKIQDNSIIEYLKSIEHPFIKDYYKLLSLETIEDKINYILNINNFYNDKINIQEKTNVDLFYKNIINLETNSLIEILNYIEEIIDEDRNSAIPISEQDNVCRVMTIHKSKGLQFDVVILYTNTTFTNNDANKNLILSDKFGLGISFGNILYSNFKQSINNIVINDSIYKDMVEEEIRILYVALTRAKYQIHIISYDKDMNKYTEDISNKFISETKSDTLNEHYLKIINHDGDDFRYKNNQLLSNIYNNQDLKNKYFYTPYLKNDINNIEINLIVEENSKKLLNEVYATKPIFTNMIKYGSIGYKYIVNNYENTNLESNYKNIIKPNYLYKFDKYNYEVQELETYTPSNHNFDIKLNFTGKNYMQKGTNIHKVFELLPDNLNWNYEMIDNLDLNIPTELYDKIIAIQNNNIYINSLQYDHYHEYPFTIKSNNKLINGIIDYISIGLEEVIIIDYKSDRLDTSEEFINHYKDQLNLYKEALNVIYPNKITKCYIYAINLSKLIEV